MLVATVIREVRDGQLFFTIVKPLQELSIEELDVDRNFTNEMKKLSQQRNLIQKYHKVSKNGLHKKFIG